MKPSQQAKRVGPDANLMLEARLNFLAWFKRGAPEKWAGMLSVVEAYRTGGEQAARRAAESWAAGCNLRDKQGAPAEWVVCCALDNARAGFKHPVPTVGFEDLRITNQPLQFVLPVELTELVFRAPWWVNKTGESIGAARARLMREFEASLDQHIAEYLDWAKAAGWSEQPVRRPRGDRKARGRRWRWLVEYLIRRRRAAEIASDAGIGERKMRETLRSAADEIGLRLLRT